MARSQSEKKRQAIFDQTVKAYHALTARSEAWCFCPLCERAFTQEDLEARRLTLEHVPPKALGGKELVLTCSACNSGAGTKVDSQAVLRGGLHAFMKALGAGESGYEGRARLGFGSVELNILLRVDPSAGGLEFLIPDSRNDPEVLRRGKEELEAKVRQGTWEGTKLSVTAKNGYHPHLARISDLRSGYLLAFAKFGYSYAFHPRLAAVREQLRNPDTESIKGFWASRAGDQAIGDQAMVLASKPIEALWVVMSQATVLLPWPWNKVAPYERMVEMYSSRSKVKLQGRSTTWPSRAELILDFGSVT